MKSTPVRRLGGAFVVAAGLGALVLSGANLGCQSREADPKEKMMTPEGQGASRRMPFGDLPARVRDSFNRDHPRATVTDSGVQVTPAGLTMYRVVYTQDRIEQEANYDADGRIVTPEMANIATRPPAALPPPSTAPANITAPP